MRWMFRILFLLVMGWAIFMVSPFVALYDLAKAVENRDLATIEDRVNFRALRISVSRQIVGDYLHTPEGRAKLGGLDGRVAANAGAAAVNPFVEELITPQSLIDVLDDGWPQQVSGEPAGAAAPLSLDVTSIEDAWKMFVRSQSEGFRSVTVPYPPDATKDDQFRLTMRLSGTTWRLTGIDLPKTLREALIARMQKETG